MSVRVADVVGGDSMQETRMTTAGMISTSTSRRSDLNALARATGEMSIAMWLSQLGLGEFTERFQKEKLTVELVAQLSNGELMGLGVEAQGDRTRLLKEARGAVLQRREDTGVGAWRRTHADADTVLLLKC